MTEEQIAKLAELLEDYSRAEIVSTILVGIFIVCMIAFSIFLGIRDKKLKKRLEEYYSTLTDEEKKKLNIYKEINKL